MGIPFLVMAEISTAKSNLAILVMKEDLIDQMYAGITVETALESALKNVMTATTLLVMDALQHVQSKSAILEQAVIFGELIFDTKSAVME